MAIAWFITRYKRRDRFPGKPFRYCAMDDYTPQIYSASGRWTETEVLGGYAIVKVKAPDAVLQTIAADPLFQRIPLNLLTQSLGELTPGQRRAIQDRIEAMGYTAEEIRSALGSNWASFTLGQVLRFAASRRRKPSYDAVQDEIVLDGTIEACRPVDSVDEEIQE